jgi:tripartite-type tricarboxylate transporter receptor subunit TctC
MCSWLYPQLFIEDLSIIHEPMALALAHNARAKAHQKPAWALHGQDQKRAGNLSHNHIAGDLSMFQRRTFSAALAATAAVAALGCSAALAQSFPTKQINMIVPNPPGGVVDSSARMIADPLARLLGQPVVIDNRGGASGNIAYSQVARSPADGYTLLISYSAYHVGNPAMFSRMPWAQSDLTPIALLTAATNVITTHPSVPANNLQELIGHLKSRPGQLNYASQGNGSLSHVGTALFEQATSTQITHVPYRGSGAAIADVLAGQVQMFMTTPPSVMGHVQTGKLRAYAVTSKARHPMMPDVPTTAEAGLSGFELEAWVGLFAPAGTPPEVVAKLSEHVKQVLAMPETKTRADSLGIEIRYMDPKGLGDLVARETEYWGKIIKDRNIRAD